MPADVVSAGRQPSVFEVAAQFQRDSQLAPHPSAAATSLWWRMLSPYHPPRVTHLPACVGRCVSASSQWRFTRRTPRPTRNRISTPTPRASATSSVSVKCLSGAAAVPSLSLLAPSPRWSAPPGPQLPLLRRQVSGAEAKARSALHRHHDPSARWCDFASVTCGAMRTSATRVSRRSGRRVPQGATAQGRTDRPGRTGFDRAARAITRGIGYLNRAGEGRHPKGWRLVPLAPSQHWPGLSMNRSIGTSTPSSHPGSRASGSPVRSGHRG